MLRVFGSDGDATVIDRSNASALPPDTVWLDLLDPEDWEIDLAQSLFGFTLPEREALSSLQLSDGYFERDGRLFMVISMVKEHQSKRLKLSPVGMLLSDRYLATLRYDKDVPVEAMVTQLAQQTGSLGSAQDLLIALMDKSITVTAEKFDRLTGHLESVTDDVFRDSDIDQQDSPERHLAAILKRIGHAQNDVSKLHLTSLTTARLLEFLAGTDRLAGDRKCISQISSMAEDARALNQHSSFLANNIAFLLDANLGVVSLRQNVVMKVISIVSLVLMPPTLIAGIYGMNFLHMPELQWPFGYVAALIAMLIAAIAPYQFFKRKGWL